MKNWIGASWTAVLAALLGCGGEGTGPRGRVESDSVRGAFPLSATSAASGGAAASSSATVAETADPPQSGIRAATSLEVEGNQVHPSAVAPAPPFLPPSTVVALHFRPHRLLEIPLVQRVLPLFLPPPEFHSPFALSIDPEVRPRWPAMLAEVDDLWVYLDGKPAGVSPVGYVVVVRARQPIEAEPLLAMWSLVLRQV